MMLDFRLVAGRYAVVCGAVVLFTLGLVGPDRATEPFPFDRELVLDVSPVPPVKRVPILSVAANGAARIDLWCRTVGARVEFNASAIRIEPAPLTDALPQYMSEGQCTPERMQADTDTLAALTQVTGWQPQGRIIVLLGPATLKFRPSDH